MYIFPSMYIYIYIISFVFLLSLYIYIKASSKCFPFSRKKKLSVEQILETVATEAQTCSASSVNVLQMFSLF